MADFSRRVFIGHLSAAAFAPWASDLLGEPAADAAAETPPPDSALPAAFPGHWETFGRRNLLRSEDAVVLQDGFAVDSGRWTDCTFSFRARAPQGAEQVQIWGGFRCRDRDSRYVFALRGGNNDDVYLARYAPDGGAEFLGIAPLGFHPEPGAWYTLRLVARGNRFHLYLNDETTPRISAQDAAPLWSEGGVSLGGGWLPVEFRGVAVRPLTQAEAAAFDAAGAGVRQPPAADREARRARQRAAYAPVTVSKLDAPRTEISLDGNWLFLPEQERADGAAPAQAVDCDDRSWHVMDVPNFWTPTLTWLHAESGFPGLGGIAESKGICDRLYAAELARLDGYTFPWRETRRAWYRHYVDLPNDPAALAGRRFALRFDAIAKVSEIWVNGIQVGENVGMFGEVNCDATRAMRPGRNVIAVHVIGRPERGPASDKVLGVAVTVEVTTAMLNSLPHGMYPNEAGGIWQPVALVVTQETWIDDLYVRPRLDGLDAELTIRTGDGAAAPEPWTISYTIRSKKDGTRLFASPKGKPERAGSDGTLHFSTPKLAPKLWSPREPNLYELEVTLRTSSGKVIDRRAVIFGFRTFEARNGRLLLNGRPFWLRGANHFPHALRPNDATLARRFLALAREGNVVATRTHTAPFSKTWLQAADEAGMLVSFEGTWPWLMLRGDPPDEDLLQAWKTEFAGMIRTHRNHPSLILWTVNNEMKFPGTDRGTPDLLKRKWTILSDMVKTMRSLDPTRPIVCDSSYLRSQVAKEYADLIQPSGFDDGDIDDDHSYFGWYDQSFFHLNPKIADGETFGRKRHWPGRPLISQEMSTGYARNDDGHPVRFYLFKHCTPQTLVGDDAYEHRNPALFLQRQAFLTKELAETFRRYDREDCSGILHFAYLSWFRDVWNADTLQPFAPYHGLKMALQPVLVSAELYGRHRYAGTRLPVPVCIANDASDGAPLPASRLVWELRTGNGRILLASGSAPVPPVPYYANSWVEIDVPIPERLPSPRVDAVLALRLESRGTVVSENAYDLALATRGWSFAGSGKAAGAIALLDPGARAPKALRERPGIAPIASLAVLRPGQSLVIAGADDVLHAPADAERLRGFLARGGRALLLDAGGALPALFPDRIKSYRTCAGEIATMHVAESPVFDGIAPLDLAWFEMGAGKLPRACRGVYRIDRTRNDAIALAEVVDRHGYLKQPGDVAAISGSPLLELRIGDGRVLASEMLLLAADEDPIAGRLLGNLLRQLD